MYRGVTSSVQDNGLFFTNSRGLGIHYRWWRPTGQTEVKACVVLLHGIAEHSGLYDRFAARLAKEGYAVLAVDHQGHGRSEGHRHYVDSIDEFLEDANTVLDMAKKEYPKVFLFGHSLGGLLSLILSTRANNQDILGMVLSAPSVGIDVDNNRIMVFAITVLARVIPRFGVTSLEMEKLVKSPKIREDFYKDPLQAQRGLPCRTLHQILCAIPEARKANPKMPVLIVHGTDDDIIPIDSSRTLECVQKTFHEVPGGFHDTFFEEDFEEHAKAVIKWLDEHLV